MELIAQGAEAKVFDNGNIVKDRFSKGYRIKEIDTSLRKLRTRREAKIMSKLREIGVKVPDVIEVDDVNMKIEMSKIDGVKLRDIFEENVSEYAYEIGLNVGKMHANDIVHTDLTTSNMIWKDGIWFIDFGLSFVSNKPEDKAVDIHVLERAIGSRHYDVAEQAITGFIEGYKEGNPDWNDVFDKWEKVKLRGRNKQKN